MLKASEPKPAIVVHDVVKEFRLKHSTSLKETFVSLFRRKQPGTREFRALDGISFEVPEGESIAVLGRNGSGKSTTLKLISGVMLPDAGWVRTRGRVAGLLEVGAGFHPDLTGRENVYLNAAILGMSRAETKDRYDEIVDFSGLENKFLDTEVKRYSSGMKSRLGFAVAVHTELDVLLVDEVLSVGDAAFRAKCNEKILELRDQGKTMFVVSHNIGTVKRLCSRGIVLSNGRIVFDGPIDEAAELVQPTSQAQAPQAPYAPKPVAKPETRPLPENTTEFDIAPELLFMFVNKEYGLGQPLEGPVRITLNGGGVMQRFERGLVTYSRALQFAQLLRPGIFLDAYLEHGGPSGEWGFVVSRVQGTSHLGETVSIRFQYGVAQWDGDQGSPIEFRPSPLASE